jgi:hypothetical protein
MTSSPITTDAAREHLPLARLPNGAGAAALFSAGLGALTLAVLAILADHSLAFKKLMIFYTPTGPLSGVTTTAIVLWLASWIALDLAWKRQHIHGRILAASLCLLAISFILMFPPIADLF